MKIEIRVPELGEGIEQVEVAAIEIAVGAAVSSGDTLVTLESDKAAMDIPAEQDGVVAELSINAGDQVGVGDLIAVLETTAADSESGADTAPDTTPAVADETANLEQSEPVISPAPAAGLQQITCPALGEGIASAEVAAIEVAVGDTIEAEQTLITLETDKAAMDLPTPVGGKVVAIKVSVGEQVKDGSLLVEIESDSVAASPAPSDAGGSSPSQPVTAPSVAEDKPAVRHSDQAPVATAKAGAAHASPAVRQFARELGADLSRVNGSGRKGRITREDVMQHVKGILQGAEPVAGGGLQPLPEIDHSRWGEVETVELGRIRQLTAKNLSRSWPQIPQVTQFDEADITDLEAFRQAQKALAEQRGVKLTLLALVMKAVVVSLRNYPDFNSSLHSDGKSLVLKRYFHIGIAVDTPAGLVVPVVRDVDRKGVFDIAEELGELSGRARDRKLTPDELQGSSFTISSLGGIGGTAFTPVVNHPNVAILGLSRSQMKPQWDGEQFLPRLMLPLSLSYDHRVIDGAVAARFTRDLAENLEELRRLLL